MATTQQAVHQEDVNHSTLKYWVVAIVLAVVTLLEVIITFLWFSSAILLFFLLILAFVKGILIVAFFMHMRGDAGIFKFAFLTPFFMAVTFLLAFLLLFLTPHVGIAG